MSQVYVDLYCLWLCRAFFAELQVSPLMGNNQGYYRVITLWGEILSAIDKWQKLGRNSFTSFLALQSSSILPCA